MIRVAVLVWLLAMPAFAVQPDEILQNPALEARARELSKNLRCLVCRNENIDESNADLARDLRLAVRERLVAGDDDAEVIDYLVTRYGEYVLLRPNARGVNLVLWLAGPIMALGGGLIALTYLRRRKGADVRPDPLSDAERARLEELTGD
ncbi:cytochrome c-type biogenesis protein CcmH [Maribius pontilimi]|uniref:Cytochrome c-type biogenesis protein n=1 Tax=Palleronia pontilimi TaxID=1964209 RepID=A0A934I7W7_9RHOB|nr:cytochrome c-type biogenesis protein [Palleronia pontilimi]MBJ3761888.1 cytochrome c-type biogenesis protein CcmH [Palleronia pontilimi]